MKLIFHNLGPLKGRQVFDLTKRFYVFVGENNSGKTYTAQLLWAVLNHYYMMEFSEIYTKDKSNAFLTQEKTDEILSAYLDFIKNEKLPIVFNINNEQTKQDLLGSFKMELEYDKNEIDFVVNIESTDNPNSPYSWAFKPKKNGASLDFKYYKKEIITDIHQKFNTEFCMNIIKSYLFHYEIKNTFIPANRLFYASFYKYIMEYERENSDKIAKAIQRGVTNGDLRKMAERPYTEPVNDLIKQIFKLNTNANTNTAYNDLIMQLAEVMGGSIETQKVEAIAMLDFVFKTKDEKELPMFLASSSANQLTLLYLYFKYWAQRGWNFLIMDEPEENLHPKNQLKLLDILLRFSAQNSNKVLITTHSPLITDAVNTYLYLNKLHREYDLDKNELIAQYKLQNVRADIDLSPADLGVYFFNGVQMIDAGNDNYGVYFRDFKNVTDGVARNNRTLTDLLYQKENEDE